MKITIAEFVKSALQPEDFPRDRRPEVAFVGRSNVGKSSLLNALLRKKGLAKTSGTPGKTQTINFFDVNARYYFVDLPGYGFAKVPKTLKEQWQRFMLAYLQERDTLKLVVALVDARHKPTERDIEMLELLEQAQIATLIVATKWDKLKQSERKPRLQQIRRTLELDEEALILPVSAVTGVGMKELWRVVDEVLEA